MSYLVEWCRAHHKRDQFPAWMGDLFPVGDGWIAASDGHEIAFVRGTCGPVEGVARTVPDFLTATAENTFSTTVGAIIKWCGGEKSETCPDCFGCPADYCAACERGGCSFCLGNGKIVESRSGEIAGVLLNLDALRDGLAGLPLDAVCTVGSAQAVSSAKGGFRMIIIEGDGWRFVRMPIREHYDEGPAVEAFEVTLPGAFDRACGSDVAP